MSTVEVGPSAELGLPDPRHAMTWASYSEQLKLLYEALGQPSYRDVERVSKRAENGIAPSTVQNLINGRTRPLRRSVVGFLLGCGLERDRHQPWLDAWDRLDAETGEDNPESYAQNLVDTNRWVIDAGADGNGLDHFQQKASGQRNAGQGGDLFRGRSAARAAVHAWIASPESPGLPLVVIGQPGAGKSSVVARVAHERQSDDDVDRGLFFFARGATHSDFLEAVTAAIGHHGCLARTEIIEVAKQAAKDERWIIIVDALDEAGSATDRDEIAASLMALSALPICRAVVATRPLTSGERYENSALLPALGVRTSTSQNLVDLDSDSFFDQSGLQAVASALLAQHGVDHPLPPDGAWRQYRHDEDLRTRLASLIAERADRNYLVAALSAHPLSMAQIAVDPAAPSFDLAMVPTSIKDALKKYLDQLPDGRRTRVRGLLTALAYARGTGLDDQLWVRFATALGIGATAEDLGMIRDSAAADYLLQTTSDVDGLVVTRLFHQALADELITRRLDPRVDERAVLAVLIPQPDSAWTDSPYALRYAADHAAACNELHRILADPHFLSHVDLHRLLPALPDQPSAEVASATDVLRRAAGRADGLRPARRAQLLALTAAHFRETDLRVRLLAACTDGLEPIWAHSLGRLHQQLVETDVVTAIAIGRLGDRAVIATAGDGGTLRTWDQFGQPIGDYFVNHNLGNLTSIAIGRLGGEDVLAAISATGQLMVWNDLGKRRDIVDPGPLIANASVAVGRFGGRDVLAVCDSGRVRTWDENGQTVGEPFPTTAHVVTTIAIGYFGGEHIIATRGTDGAIRAWSESPGAGRSGRVIANYGRMVKSLAVGTLDGIDVIATASDDRTVQLWDVRGNPLGDPLTDHTEVVTVVAIGALGSRNVIATACVDRAVRVWDGASAVQSHAGQTDHSRRVNAVAAGRFGRSDILASASDDLTVRIWDRDGVSLGEPLLGFPAQIAVAVGRLAEGSVIVAVSQAGTIKIWNSRGQSMSRSLNERPRATRALAAGLISGRNVIATADHDGNIEIWGEGGSRIGDSLDSGKGAVVTLELGRFGEHDVIVALHDSGQVVVWNYHERRIDRVLEVRQVTSMALGRMGGHEILVTAHQNGAVRIWNDLWLRVGDPFEADDASIQAVAAGRFGDRYVVAAASKGRTITVWDIDSRSSSIIDLLEVPHGVLLPGDGRLYAASGKALCAWQRSPAAR